MAAPRFFVKTFQLDNVFTRSQQNGHHWAGSTVRAVKVLETNNENFSLDFVPDPWEGHSQGLPLKDVRTHNLQTIADNAVFENHTPQPGVWVKVLFTTEDLLDGSSRGGSGSGAEVIVTGGLDFENDKHEVTTAGDMLLDADDNRACSEIHNTSSATIFIGKQEKIIDADFENTCLKIAPGKSYKWNLPVALFARVSSDSANPVDVVILTRFKT